MVASAHFTETLPNFVGDCLAYYACKRDENGPWFAAGSPNLLVSSSPMPWHPKAPEKGWSRWALPGADGVARSRLQDKAAPWAEVSPRGQIFLHLHPHTVRRMNLGQLLDAAANRAHHVGAAMGWPAAGKVAPAAGGCTC